MNFTLIIRSHPLTDQGSQSALNFAQSLYKNNHTIESIFFYQNGVYHAIPYELPQDEPNLSKKWIALSCEFNFKLIACHTACQKRGITNHHQAYQLKGLGLLADSMIRSDRVIEF